MITRSPDFNPAAPGAIGGTTPAAITGTAGVFSGLAVTAGTGVAAALTLTSGAGISSVGFNDDTGNVKVFNSATYAADDTNFSYVGIYTNNNSTTPKVYVSRLGHLRFGTDNANDIGAAGANRPGTGHFGTSLLAPTITAATSLQATGVLGVRALSTLTDGADGTNTSGYKFVSFVSNSAEAGNVIRVAQTAAVVFTTSSSRELKNLRGDSNLEAAHGRTMAYRMRAYDWKSQPGTLFNGPFSEEIYAVNPDPMLFPDGDKTINMAGFIPEIIMTVQHQQQQIDKLLARLETQ